MLSLRQLGIKRGLPSDFFECTGMATGTGRWRWLACCQVNHSATSTWIFNFASQQQGKVICRVDVPGLADEQWPGSTRSVDGEGGGGSRVQNIQPNRSDPNRSEPNQSSTRIPGQPFAVDCTRSSCRSIRFNANNSYKFMWQVGSQPVRSPRAPAPWRSLPGNIGFGGHQAKCKEIH